MVLFMLLYTFLPLLWGGMTAEQSMQDFRGLPLNFPSMAGHLWFMYPLLGLYLFMPVISPWLERATRREEQVFLGIFLLSTFMPFLHRFVQPYLWGECFWNGFHMLWYFSGYIGYLVLAHYVRFHLDWPARKRLVVGAAAFLAGAAFTIWSFYWKTPPGVLVETPVAEWAWEFCTPNVLCATFGAFLLFSCIRRPSAVVEGTSRISFGIYLVHLFVLNVWVRLLVGEGGAAAPAVPVAAAIPLIALCTFLSSALIVKVFSLIPGSRWLIG
jgi:surface polysaccharide O-acyltransferase-like enzyme